MIDRRARTRLAERLRHLASAQMTNDAFEDSALRTKDMAVREIENRFAQRQMERHRPAGSRR